MKLTFFSTLIAAGALFAGEVPRAIPVDKKSPDMPVQDLTPAPVPTAEPSPELAPETPTKGTEPNAKDVFSSREFRFLAIFPGKVDSKIVPTDTGMAGRFAAVDNQDNTSYLITAIKVTTGSPPDADDPVTKEILLKQFNVVAKRNDALSDTITKQWGKWNDRACLDFQYASYAPDGGFIYHMARAIHIFDTVYYLAVRASDRKKVQQAADWLFGSFMFVDSSGKIWTTEKLPSAQKRDP